MRFVHISDIHNWHNNIKVPDGDCLIVSGDFTGLGTIQEIASFNHWLGTLPHRHKIVVAGNHDKLFETNRSLAEAMLSNAKYLEDKEIIIEGIRIYGSPWQKEFHNWAFNLPAGAPLKEKWDLIPSGIDILVTHSPPFGILDYIPGHHSYQHLGCPELLDAVMRINPTYHLFGHIHYAHGIEIRNGTTFINSAICNEGYDPIQAPHVFDIIK